MLKVQASYVVPATTRYIIKKMIEIFEKIKDALTDPVVSEKIITYLLGLSVIGIIVIFILMFLVIKKCKKDIETLDKQERKYMRTVLKFLSKHKK